MSSLFNMPAFASGTLLHKLDKTFILLFQLKMLEIFLPFQQQQYYPLIAFTLQPWGGNGGKQDSLCLRPQQQSAFTMLSAGNRAKQTAWGAHTYFPGCFWIWQPSVGTSAQVWCLGMPSLQWVPFRSLCEKRLSEPWKFIPFFKLNNSYSFFHLLHKTEQNSNSRFHKEFVNAEVKALLYLRLKLTSSVKKTVA